jgi:hypothetical protein
MNRFKEKLKDLFYDKNDLFIAIIVLVLAGLLIQNRIGVIMDYPAIMAAQASSENSLRTEAPKEPAENKPASPAETSNEASEEEIADPEEPDVPGNTETPDDPIADSATSEPAVKQVSIYIEYGATGSQIAQLLVDSGLITEKQQFYDAVRTAGAETRLQAGNFKIPSNASPAQIIDIITR